MPQLFPNPVSSTQNLTINTTYPLTGGGPVSLGGNITLAVSSSQNSNRNQYTVTPAPNGVVANFTINNTGSSLSVPYADVYINGKIQLTSNYSLAGNVLSFNTAPAIGAAIYAVFAQPADQRQMYTLTPATDGVTTIFSFPTTQPFGSYVDIYVGQNMQTVGVDYFLNINNGVYTVHFTVAPTAGSTLVAVFDASVNSGRGQYTVTPAATGSITTFQIIGGSPSSPYIDVFVNGLFKAESIDYSFQYVSGQWTVTFAIAPPAAASIVTIFAPTTVLPSPSSVSSVGLSLPGSVFTVTGSPVTTIGTLTGAFNAQSAHTMFSGPTSGSAVPTFRTISTADLSDVSNIALKNTANTFTATQTAPTFVGALTGNATTSTTSSNIASGSLGSLPYQTAASTTSLLAGNTTATTKVLTQTGTGTVSAAPAWTTPTGTGSPVFSASPTLTGTAVANILQANKLIASGTTPIVTVGPAAGTGASATITGHDGAGTVSITLGTATTTGVLATVTFNTAYSADPTVAVTALGVAASTACQPYIGRNTSVLIINAGVAPAGAVGSGLFYDFHVIGV